MDNNERVFPDPDPEIARMIEAMEEEGAEDDRTPDGILLDVLEGVRDQIDLTVAETEEWGANTAQMAEINRGVVELANVAIRLHDRLTMRSALDKLHMMRETEQRNDESIRKWSEKRETL